MNLVYIIISIVLIIVVLESIKHLFTKSIFHFIMIALLVIVVLFLVFEGLGTDSNFVKDNSVVATGAAVSEVIKESDLFGDFSFEDINPLSKIKNLFSNSESDW